VTIATLRFALAKMTDQSTLELDTKSVRSLVEAHDELVAALRLFLNPSMTRSEFGGETFIGWQRGEGLDARGRLEYARAALAAAEQA
jgi:hypothetical protein